MRKPFGIFSLFFLFLLLQGCHYSLIGKEIAFSPTLDPSHQRKRVEEYRAWMLRYLVQKGWHGAPPTSKKSEIAIYPFPVTHLNNERTIFLMVRCRKNKRKEALAFLDEMVAHSRSLFPDVALLHTVQIWTPPSARARSR